MPPTTTPTITRSDLTDAEQSVLALFGAHGDDGMPTWGEHSHPSVGDGGTAAFEAAMSLKRFGLLEPTPWRRDRASGYRLTAQGATIYAEQRQAVSYYSRCPACVRLHCVCSYRLSCMAAAAPLLTVPERHPSLGCHGTHD